MAKKEKKAEDKQEEVLTTFKGFDKNLQCRGYQYEVGGTYKHDGEVSACNGGFHACEYPLDVLGYYEPAGNRFCQVEQSGTISKHSGDSKVASGTIKISAEIGIPGLIKAAIEYTFKRALPVDKDSPAYSDKEKGATSATGDQGAASATGGRGAASATGDQGAASATGDQGAASATGYQGAASATGDYGAASATGGRGAASATGDYGAASATGDQGAASATGGRGAASATGYQGAASAMGKDSAAMSSGYQGKAKGIEGSAIFLVYRDNDYKIIHAKAAIVGQDGIRPDVFYMLNESGEFIEVE